LRRGHGGLGAGTPIHLAVICPTAANTEIAVANTTAITACGSPLTSSFTSRPAGTPGHQPGPDHLCHMATRDSVNTSVPFDPATAEIPHGPAAHTIGAQARPLLFGGNLTAEPFHAAMIC
jgi:hypothetical protein